MKLDVSCTRTGAHESRLTSEHVYILPASFYTNLHLPRSTFWLRVRVFHLRRLFPSIPGYQSVLWLERGLVGTEKERHSSIRHYDSEHGPLSVIALKIAVMVDITDYW